MIVVGAITEASDAAGRGEVTSGKAVLIDSVDLDSRAAYEFLGDYVEQMGGRFFTGPDVGTSDDDLRAVASHTRFCADPDEEGFRGLADSTARGVLAAVQATAAYIGASLEGLRVIVQGVGSVGRRLCALLSAAGAELLVADLSPAAVDEVVSRHHAVSIDVEDALTTPCDLFVPCALGGVLDIAAAEKIPTRAISGAANNVLANAEAGAVLHRREIPVAPDFIANAGGLIHGVSLQLTGVRPAVDRIDRIGRVVGELLQRSWREDVPPGELALAVARQRVTSGPARPFLPPR